MLKSRHFYGPSYSNPRLSGTDRQYTTVLSRVLLRIFCCDVVSCNLSLNCETNLNASSDTRHFRRQACCTQLAYLNMPNSLGNTTTPQGMHVKARKPTLHNYNGFSVPVRPEPRALANTFYCSLRAVLNDRGSVWRIPEDKNLGGWEDAK